MKRRISFGAGVVIVTAVLAAMAAGCREKPQPAAAGDVIEYFVNPTPDRFARLAGEYGDTATLNEAFRAVRAKASTAFIHEWLTDTAGVQYLVGGITPRAIAPDSLYPLMIYLHGGTGSERNDKGDSAWAMFKALEDTLPIFLASPSANRYAPWWSAEGLSRILQTLRYMTLHYPIDPNRVFLSGVSDGATGCYAAAATIPGPFAGFIAVSGFGGMLPMIGFPFVPTNLRHRPMYNVNAGRDRIYPVEDVKAFVVTLQELGVPVTSKIYPDELHGFDYRDKEMGTIAGLLRTWSLPRRSGFSWKVVEGCPNDADNLIGWSTTGLDADIQGAMQGDTLAIRRQDLASVSFTLPGRSGKLICQFVTDKGRTRRVPPVAPAWPDNLRLMVHSCFPGFSGAPVYTVKFR